MSARLRAVLSAIDTANAADPTLEAAGRPVALRLRRAHVG